MKVYKWCVLLAGWTISDNLFKKFGFEMKFVAQQKWEPVATVYVGVPIRKLADPSRPQNRLYGNPQGAFFHNLKYPLNKVVIRVDDLEKVLIHILKLERQIVQGYLVLCVDDSKEEEEDDYNPLAVSPLGPTLSLDDRLNFF